MSDLTAFLLARLDEDEAVARQAIDPNRPGTHWQWMSPDTDAPLDPDEFRANLRTVEEYPTTSGVGDLPAFPLGYVELDETYALPHIARHDPARVLAEVQAKRAIVAQDADPIGPGGGYPAGWASAHDFVVRTLAAVYSDHPGYDERWRP